MILEVGGIIIHHSASQELSEKHSLGRSQMVTHESD